MTAVETPPVEPQAEERRCPRCSAPLRPEQEWCLSCGAGLGAQMAAPRGWRWPLAVVAGLLVLMVAALALALVELASNSEKILTPTPTAQAPAATATPAGATTPVPTASAAPSTVSDWPAGKTGYTVVLESSASRSAADARAKELAAQNIPVGVLDTSGYASLTPDRFVVFSGQYTSRAEARAALRALQGRVTGARVGRVAPA